MAIFVVTCPEAGWDCVCGVYEANSEKEVAEQYYAENNVDDIESAENWMDENNYIIHQTSLTKVN